MDILILINIYIVLVLAANILVGWVNLFSICQAAFYGIGAYLGAWLLLHFKFSLLFTSIVVMTLTGLSSILVSYASTKLKGDYFVLASLAFQMIVCSVLKNWIPVTRGPYGITGIPTIRVMGVEVDGELDFLFLTLVVVAVMIVMFNYLRKSPFGRVLLAIRSDEVVVDSKGRSSAAFKNRAIFISAAFTGLGGLLFASYVSFIDPSCFELNESIFILSALFIGGIGGVKGPVLGAVFVGLVPTLVRALNLPDNVAPNLNEIIYGILLVVVMFVKPQGVLGEDLK